MTYDQNSNSLSHVKRDGVDNNGDDNGNGVGNNDDGY